MIAGMTVSLDGYVADRECGVERLYPDFAELRDSDYMKAGIAETGAVLMGRRTFDMADDPDSYADSYELQVPIFVVTHHPPAAPPRENERLTFTFVTDGLETAAAQARAAAGDKVVTVVGGATLIQDLLLAGLVDELDIDIMPVFLGGGLRFLDSPALEGIRLEKIRVQDVGARTNLRLRVVRPS
jgi:dihydrofolate reductase